MRAIAEVGVESITSTVVATRGERLALNRVRLSGRRGEFSADVLEIAEIDADNRIDASVLFDADDIDAAFDELDARYLAGEAATHAHTWSLVAGAYAALNRRELPATTPDWVNIDHRRATGFAPGDLTANIRAAWNQIPNLNFYIEAVHRLSNLGAVVTNAARGTSQEGFDADWRSVDLLMFDGDLINYCEQFFDDAELGAALARFDELSPRPQRLENAASQVYERFWMCFAARDWGAAAALMADDVSSDDRRRVVGAGIRRGRDAAIADARAAADVGLGNEMSTLIAIRGERLALGRVGLKGGDPHAFHIDALHIVEVDADERLAKVVVFELDDIDAAIEELNARYLAGEAAAYARTWSVIARTYASLNRHEVPPTTPNWVNIDHRRGTPFASGEFTTATMRATSIWEIAPDFRINIEAVHRLSSHGAVVTHAAHGTSREGFDAEWRTDRTSDGRR